MSRRSPRRRAGLFARWLLAIGLALTLAGAATARGGDPALYPARDGGVPIFLVDNGYHTEIAVSAEALAGQPGPLAIAAAQGGAGSWVSLGWGDATFFVAQGVSAARVLDGLRAAFGPHNPSIVRIEVLPQAPEQLYGRDGVLAVRLSKAGFARLVGRIDRSLAVAADGAPVRSPAVPRSPGERFYVSVERFSLIHLCNHWTAEALNAAGLATTPVLDVLPWGLKLDLRLRDGVLPA